VIESISVRWLLTVVFAASALLACAAQIGVPGRWAGLRRPESAGARRDDLAVGGFCLAMCGALIVMAWWAEPATATWVQAAGFGTAGLWFVLASRGQAGLPSLTGVFHALMAGVMIWMLTALPGAAQMATPMSGRSTMTGMSAATVPGPVVAISVLIAVGCAVAAIPWLVRSFGPGLRFSDPAAAGQAVMSAGMAAMLMAMV
jgi:hypothetical protein